MVKRANDKLFSDLYLLAHWNGQTLNIYFKPISLNQQSAIQNFVLGAMDASGLSPNSSTIHSDRNGMAIEYGFARHDWDKANTFCKEFEGQYGYDAPNAVPINGRRKDRSPVVRKPTPSV